MWGGLVRQFLDSSIESIFVWGLASSGLERARLQEKPQGKGQGLLLCETDAFGMV